MTIYCKEFFYKTKDYKHFLIFCFCFPQTDYSEWDFRWLRKWTMVGAFSAAESATRNLVYLFVILRPFNVLHEQVFFLLNYASALPFPQSSILSSFAFLTRKC